MVCEQILGKLSEFDTSGKTIEYVDIEWHEAFKKIHKKTTDHGTELGIRMDDSILTRGLYQGDVLYADDEKIIAVNTPPCEVIRVSLTPGHEKQAAKVCYEIGNRHAPLFWGENDTFITIYNEPMLLMLQKLHGVTAEKELKKLHCSFPIPINSRLKGAECPISARTFPQVVFISPLANSLRSSAS